jgi:spermidine synthase
MSGAVGVSRESESASASALLLAAIGCFGGATQLVLLRELLAAYGGNELSAGVTVAAWILCEAAGAWLAGRLRSSLHSLLLPALSILLSLAAVPAAVLVRPALGILPGETLSIPVLLLATSVVLFLPAASHGALFVTAAAHRTQGIGSAYVWEGVGTVLAGFICFVLFSRLPSMSLLAACAVPLVAAAGFGSGRTRTRWTIRALGLGVLTALVFALPVERWVWGAAWRGQQVADIANSSYGKIVRLQREGQQLILYDGIPVLAVPPVDIERIEELALLPILYHPAPRRVLFVGQDLAIPAALVRFRPEIEVTTLQLDAILARACLAALSLDSSLITHYSSIIASLTISDPVSYLRTTADTFDCIILTDAVPSSLGASRLFSFEFYRLCRSRLAAGGLLATAGPGEPTALSPDAARVLSTRVRTLSAAFDQIRPVAADFPLLLASDSPLCAATETLASRLVRLSETPKLLDSNYLVGLLDPFRQEALTSALEPGALRTVSGVSSATTPRELFLNMVRENRLASPAFGTLYGRLGNLSAPLLLSLGIGLLVVGIVGAFSGGHPFGRGFAVLTSGFSGAAVSSLLLFAWQIRFGSVFSGVALLVATFMLGTVLGGILGTRSVLRAHHPSLSTPRFLISDLVLAACAAVTLVLVHSGPAAAFLAVNCLAGACLGFQFAVAGFAVGRSGPCPTAPRSSLIVSAPGSAARRAGTLTALDLVGGSLGGLLTALVAAPALGISIAALIAGAVKLTSACTQLMPGRPDRQT